MDQYFDNIYILYINEAEKFRIQQKLIKIGIKAQLFLGVDGQKEKVKYQQYQKLYKTLDSSLYRELSIGQFGHVSSFINILKDCVDHQYKRILILEPDIYFATDLNGRCEKYFNMDIFRTAKLMYFGCSQNKFYNEETWKQIVKNNKGNLKEGYYLAYKSLGTFAVGFDCSVVEPYLKLLEQFTYTSDVALTKIQEEFYGRCVVCYPNLICCDICKSATSANRLYQLKQTDIVDKYRWSVNYDFEDHYKFLTTPGQLYSLILDINSNYKNHRITLYDHDNKVLLEEQNIDKLKHNTIFKPSSNSVIMKAKNIFFNNITIVPKKHTKKIYKK